VNRKQKSAVTAFFALVVILVSYVSYTMGAGGFTRNIYMQDLPSGYSYVIKTDGVYCWAVADDGSILTYGTNATAVLKSAAGNSSIYDSICIEAGIVGSGVAECIVGNATGAFSVGQVVYPSSSGFYALADASADSTIGYGQVFLNVLNCSANAKCLLMEHGFFTLASWSWSAGLLWVDTDAGDLTQIYPSGSGDQLCVPASYVNATTIKFDNPDGVYGEHV
jgi:hypothetical protein